MRKSIALLGLAALAVVVFATGCEQGSGPATGEKAPAATNAPKAAAGKPQTSCPVMGGKVEQTVYADHDGKRVYFCCPSCVETFKKDPEKYVRKLEDAGVTLAKAPAETK